jgi:hypothetical protein
VNHGTIADLKVIFRFFITAVLPGVLQCSKKVGSRCELRHGALRVMCHKLLAAEIANLRRVTAS